MPVFHINIYNDEDVPDVEGTEFPDLDAAVAEAIRGGRALIAEHVISGKPIHLADRIEVTNANQDVVAVVAFGEMVTFTDGIKRAR